MITTYTSADRDTDELLAGPSVSQAIDVIDRLAARQHMKQQKNAKNAYGKRRLNPQHTFPCEHPQCEVMFNRRGLLQHM